MIKKSLAVLVLMGSVGVANASPVNLVSNGDFESGMTGWSGSNWVGSNPYASNGTNSLNFGCVGGYCDTWQNVSVTSGTAYDFKFDYGSDAGTPNGMNVFLNGNNIFSTSNDTSFGWTAHLFSYVANSSSLEIRFSGFNNPSWLGIDNVSLIESNAIPEPTSIALLGMGVLGFAASRRKTKV